MTAMDSTHGPGTRLYLTVWIGLLAIVGIEVALTYAGLPTGTLLTALLALAITEAALGIAFFMHMKYERPLLFWALIPAIVFVFIMMNHVWRDASRLLHMHT